MNNDDEEDDIIQAEQGPLNPYWMLRSISLHSTLSMFIRGMFGVSFYLEKRQGEYLDPLEIVDVIIQYMYTGEYSYPFPDEDQEEWDEPLDPITEEEVNEFKEFLDFLTDHHYDEDEGDRKGDT